MKECSFGREQWALRPTITFDDFCNKTKRLSGGPIFYFFSSFSSDITCHQKPNTQKVDNVPVSM